MVDLIGTLARIKITRSVEFIARYHTKYRYFRACCRWTHSFDVKNNDEISRREVSKIGIIPYPIINRNMPTSFISANFCKFFFFSSFFLIILGSLHFCIFSAIFTYQCRKYRIDGKLIFMISLYIHAAFNFVSFDYALWSRKESI